MLRERIEDSEGLFLPKLARYPYSQLMDREMIIFLCVMALTALVFVAADKWQKAEKKLKHSAASNDSS